jgi:hypothetical protein
MWTAMSVIHLLGQRHRFETFDFSYFVLRADEGV